MWAKKIRSMMTEGADLGGGEHLEGDDFEEHVDTMEIIVITDATLTNL